MNDPSLPLDNSERRRFPRKLIGARLQFTVISSIKGEGITKDISAGGLRIIIASGLPNGTVLELDFQLPGKEPEPVRVQAKIVWQKKIPQGYLTGVEFVL